MEFIDKIKVKLLHYTWCIAYGHYDESIITQGIDVSKLHIVKNPYKGKWFADPFILEVNENNIQFLVEEFDKSIGRGRIARITVDKEKDIITDCNIVLEEQTHLSFPAIYRREGKIFVHPENYKSGKSYIYEYDKVNVKLVNPLLISDEPLTDAIIVDRNYYFEMFSTCGENPNGNELKILKSQSFLGKYKQEKTLRYSHNSARMAGYVIETMKGEIRPAQLCEDAYGRAILFYRGNVTVGSLLPWGKYDGLHTFNTYNDLFVIDLKKYDFPWIYRIKNRIK